MTHDSVWFSRPRKFGKGSRQWYVVLCLKAGRTDVLWVELAASALTKLVSSANMVLICAANVSVKSLPPLGL